MPGRPAPKSVEPEEAQSIDRTRRANPGVTLQNHQNKTHLCAAYSLLEGERLLIGRFFTDTAYDGHTSEFPDSCQTLASHPCSEPSGHSSASPPFCSMTTTLLKCSKLRSIGPISFGVTSPGRIWSTRMRTQRSNFSANILV